MTDKYHLSVSARATRQLGEVLTPAVAFAVWEFMNGALIDNPQRVGKALHGPLSGKHGARRGTFRIIYVIDEANHRVEVVDIDHRRDVFRPR